MSPARVRPFVLAFASVALLAPAATWADSQLSEGTWSALPGGGTAPSPRREYAAIYDDAHQRYLIFAGAYGDLQGGYLLFNQVWVLSLDGTPTWSNLPIAGTPPGERHSPQWGYDPANKRILVFGGYGRHHEGDDYEYLNDVWQLSLGDTPEWTEITPAGTPPTGRLAGSAVYDPLRQRFVGFGGTIGVPVDTWSLDLSGPPQWSTIDTDSLSPNGGYSKYSVYDSARDRLLIFGGSTSDAYFGVTNDTWALDLQDETPTWHMLAAGGPLPKARRAGTAIYDPLRDRMVVYGGWDGAGEQLSSFLDDTWALSFAAGPQWDQLSPGGTTPPGRDAIAAAYDPIGDRMVVFGGWSGQIMMNDTQFLTWGGEGLAATLSPDAAAEPGIAHLDWTVQNSFGTHAAVYRRNLGGDWKSIGTAEVNAQGVVSYDDYAVAPGTRYGYMCVVNSHRGSTFGGVAWVDIPSSLGVPRGSALVFALDPASPNPAVHGFTASFSLPSAAPAKLELIDLAGRRVFSRDVGVLGPGAHTIDLGRSGEFAPGMYFMRLTQANRSASRRVAVIGAR